MRNLGAALLFLLWLTGAASAQVVTTREFPQGPTINPLTASTTGTTGSVTATLTGVSGKYTYICGFIITSGGTTAAANADVTVTGIPTTMHFNYVFVSSGQGVLGVALPGCITSSAKNTSIAVVVPGGGAGTTVSVSSWGYTN